MSASSSRRRSVVARMKRAGEHVVNNSGQHLEATMVAGKYGFVF